MEILDVVDGKNRVTGKASKREVYERGLNHRIVHVLVFNSKGEMLLQLRSGNVGFRPGHWVTSAGGHVISGESYEKAASRELYEEIGVKGRLHPFCKEKYPYEASPSGRKGIKFIEVFRTVIESGFMPDMHDVEKVGFFSLEKIREMIRRGEKFHPELLFILRKHFPAQ